MKPRERIIERLDREGIVPKTWRKDEEDGLTAVLGPYRVLEDDEDAGLYSGDEGQLTACVVGSSEYGNERVCFTFLADEYAGDKMAGNEVRNLDIVEAVW